MRKMIIFLLLSFLSTDLSAQSQTFEIFGTIDGEYNSKIFFFYDGNYRQKDSISADIKNGKFYFKADAVLPIQIRLHLGQQSYISDVFVDSKKVFLNCNNKLEIYGSGKDTVNVFNVSKVRGSSMEGLKRNFENWLYQLNASGKNENEIKQEYNDKLYEFVSGNRKSKVSAYLIGKASMLSYWQVSLLYDLLDSSLQNTFELRSVKQLQNRLKKADNKSIGSTFLDVVLHDTSGSAISTKDLRGKYVLVDFWASWCKPCRESNPGLKRLYNKLSDENFEILGVSFDKDKAKWKGAILKDGLTWIQAIDEKGFLGTLGKHYAINAIPQNILIDVDGKILGVGLSDVQIEEMIQKTQ